jgi:hypothetical protein
VLANLPYSLGLPLLIVMCLALKSNTYLEGIFDTDVGVQCVVSYLGCSYTSTARVWIILLCGGIHALIVEALMLKSSADTCLKCFMLEVFLPRTTLF